MDDRRYAKIVNSKFKYLNLKSNREHLIAICVFNKQIQSCVTEIQDHI